MEHTLEYEFDFADTVLVALTDGSRYVQLLANVELTGRIAVLRGFHIQGSGRNMLGPGTLRKLAKWAKAELDVDELPI
jgi:hypothetical protein